MTDIVAGRLTTLTPDYGATLVDLVEGAVGVILADPYLYPVVAAAVPQVPLIYDAYNCEYILKSQMLPDTPAGRELLDEVRRVEQRASTESALVLSVSVEDRANINELYGTPSSRFALAPNGLDLPRVPYTPISQRHKNRERWLAALRAKGTGHGLRWLATFVGSWHLPNNDAARTILDLAPQLPDVGFLLLGSHTMSLRRLPLPPNVFLLGEVSDAVKTTVLATADIALAPLTSGSGTNLKVVEYLGAGVPVVSTAVGIRGLDVPRECVRLATIDQFAAAIRVELSASDSQERALRARLAVERRYDWASVAARVAPRIERALADG